MVFGESSEEGGVLRNQSNGMSDRMDTESSYLAALFHATNFFY
jgi:hypothetical protein